MKVLVDSSVWSLALRRSSCLTGEDQRVVWELTELISEARVAISGPIGQELLSGISQTTVFEQLKEKLQAFDDLPLNRLDYETAADFYNRCRQAGIQGSPVDFLICATASGRNMPIYTTDQDFIHFSRIIPFALHQPRN